MLEWATKRRGLAPYLLLYEASNKEEGLYKGENSKTIKESFKDKKVTSFPPFSFVHK
ncbi:unnamed protein product [Prunus armeniaca]